MTHRRRWLLGVITGASASLAMSGAAHADDIWTDREQWDRNGVELRCCVPGKKGCRSSNFSKARNDTPIVGESQCSRFGDDWSTEFRVPIAVHLGLTMLHVPGNTLRDPTTGSVRRSPLNLPAGEVHVTYFFLPIVYGGLLVRGWNFFADAGYMTVLPAIGARLPLGRFSLRGEMATGLGAIGEGPDNERTTKSWFWVEPRVGIDVWIDSRVTLSATAGTSLTSIGITTASFGITFHGRAYDGTFVP